MAIYQRVTYQARCKIEAYIETEVSVAEIARRLGYHKSTIYREIMRNGLKVYNSGKAQSAARKRYRRCRRKRYIQGEVEEHILKCLSKGWSPQQIAHRYQRERKPMVSMMTIYRWIHRNCHRRYKRYLRRYNQRGGSRKLHRIAHKKGKVPIDQRPQVANERRRIGDWERDTFYAAQRKQVLVCTDRKSRYTKMEKLKALDLDSVNQQTLALLKQTKRKAMTMTNDNGPEFRKPLPMPFPLYYCHPHKPQQRGTVENTIGLIRQYISRKTQLDDLSQKDIQEIEYKLNHRPRKILDYRTPFEVFYKKSVAMTM